MRRLLLFVDRSSAGTARVQAAAGLRSDADSAGYGRARPAIVGRSPFTNYSALARLLEQLPKRAACAGAIADRARGRVAEAGRPGASPQLQRRASPSGGTIVEPPPTCGRSPRPRSWNIFSPRDLHDRHRGARDRVAKLSLADQRRLLATAAVGAMLETLAAVRVAEINRVGLRAALERLALTKTRLQVRPRHRARCRSRGAGRRGRALAGDRRRRGAAALARGARPGARIADAARRRARTSTSKASSARSRDVPARPRHRAARRRRRGEGSASSIAEREVTTARAVVRAERSTSPRRRSTRARSRSVRHAPGTCRAMLTRAALRRRRALRRSARRAGGGRAGRQSSSPRRGSTRWSSRRGPTRAVSVRSRARDVAQRRSAISRAASTYARARATPAASGRASIWSRPRRRSAAPRSSSSLSSSRSPRPVPTLCSSTRSVSIERDHESARVVAARWLARLLARRSATAKKAGSAAAVRRSTSRPSQRRDVPLYIEAVGDARRLRQRRDPRARARLPAERSATRTARR